MLMGKPALSEWITGTCRWCGDHGDIYRDSRLCERCDGNVIRCAICKEDQHHDDPCRHVFQNSDFEWMGAGVGIPHAYQLEGLKRSLFKLFGLMPGGFAADLRTAIGSGRFHTWLVAPLIGGGGTLSLYGMPDRDGKCMLHAWGDELIMIGEGDHAEECHDGYRWLVSLYERKTLKANRATIGWIDEFGPSKSDKHVR